MSDDLTYTGSPALTVEFVESGEIEDADDPELDNDCLSGIVCDLARAGRADLALPYIERWAKEYDAALGALLVRYATLARVEAVLATLPSAKKDNMGLDGIPMLDALQRTYNAGAHNALYEARLRFEAAIRGGGE